MAPQELELFAHEPGHAAPEIMDVLGDSLKRLGLPLESAHYTDADLERQVRAVADMGANELVAEAASDAAAADLVFALAERVATAGTELAWRALHALPLARVVEVPAVALVQPDHRTLIATAFGASTRPRRPVVIGLDGAWTLREEPTWSARPLTGFKTGWLLRADAPGPEALHPVAADIAHRYMRLNLALLCGMLSGALARVIELAYQHARARTSGGKPLLRHQAVALRLGELTMRGDALLLLLRQHHYDLQRGRAALARSPGALEHISESAAWISRNALQVAAGHGFVEGLLFKTLNEQIRTLVNALMVNARTEPRHVH